VEITREEALGELELLATKKRFKLTPGEASALDVAIKVLEQKPCEDAIIRADAIDLFGHGREWTEQEAQEAIRSLPPVRSICQRQQNDVPDTNVGKICDDVLDKIRAEIEQAADKQFQIAMGVADLNERCTHIRMENAYRHSLNIIDKYKAESGK
jgi:hypothetical protein